MGRPRLSLNPKSQAMDADSDFMDEMVALVRHDGHSLSLTARKALIGAIERYRSVLISHSPTANGSGQMEVIHNGNG